MPYITLTLEGSTGRSGTTKFRFTEDAATGKDSYDAYRLSPFTSSYALIASRMEGTDALFDHQNLPLPSEEAVSVDLSLDVTAAGSYSLAASRLDALPDDWQVVIEDVSTGTLYDLRAGETVPVPQAALQRAAATTGDVSIAKRLNPQPSVATAVASAPTYRLHVGPDVTGPLPVELASFESTLNGSDAVLTWRTLSETNNAGFEVQRRAVESTEAASAAWSTVGFVEGAGTTTEPQSYRFTVEDLSFGTHRFRLRQVDTDGTASFSDRTEVKVGLEQSHVVKPVYPNPVRGEATLEFAVKKTEAVTVSLYNLLGQRVRTVYQGTPRADAFETVRIRTSDLASGVYLLRVDGERFSDTQRLSIVH
jgi:hypothetical protein